jgi:hypothetical protein
VTPEAMALRARMATNARMAKYGGEYLTANAHQSMQSNLNARLIKKYGIDMSAPDADDRLARARSLYYQQMALKRWRNK